MCAAERLAGREQQALRVLSVIRKTGDADPHPQIHAHSVDAIGTGKVGRQPRGDHRARGVGEDVDPLRQDREFMPGAPDQKVVHADLPTHPFRDHARHGGGKCAILQIVQAGNLETQQQTALVPTVRRFQRTRNPPQQDRAFARAVDERSAL